MSGRLSSPVETTRDSTAYESAMPTVEAFFDSATATVTYVVSDPASKRCAVIDPVLDFDPKGARTSEGSVEQVIEYVQDRGLEVDWILETHVHADHLSGAQTVKSRVGGTLAIGEHVAAVQSIFGDLFNVEPEFTRDGSQFDHLFRDGDVFHIGTLEARVMHTPGHTPACVTYVIDDSAFVGDTLFMPDCGTARADFPGGDAGQLYRSIQSILALPPGTRLFMCHDYPPAERTAAWETTVQAERDENVHVGGDVGEAEFVSVRNARDKTLAVPALLLPSVQVNMRAGCFPPPEANGVSYLKLPLNRI